jgi:hypothetical protein
MTAPRFQHAPSHAEWLLFGIRVLMLVLCAATFIVPVLAQSSGNISTEVAVNGQRILELEKASVLVMAQHTALTERVSRIEGIGIGLGMLTAVQLFLQITNTITLKRKER